MSKKIAVYGSYKAKVPYKQRFWKKRKDGIKQRYWRTTKRTREETMTGRYEFNGNGRDLYRAVVKALDYVPRGFIDISAEEFLKHPEKYGYEGEWIDREVES